MGDSSIRSDSRLSLKYRNKSLYTSVNEFYWVDVADGWDGFASPAVFEFCGPEIFQPLSHANDILDALKPVFMNMFCKQVYWSFLRSKFSVSRAADHTQTWKLFHFHPSLWQYQQSIIHFTVLLRSSDHPEHSSTRYGTDLYEMSSCIRSFKENGVINVEEDCSL